MAVIVSDQFEEAANTDLTAHVPDTAGTGWTQRHNTSTLKFVVFASGDIVGCNGSENGVGFSYTSDPDPTAVEYDIQVDLAAVDSSSNTRPLWIFARYTDAQNWYGIRILPPAHATVSLTLYKSVAGTQTSLGTYDAALVNGDTILFEIRDAAKKVYHEGTERISSADNALTSAGRAGVGQGNDPDAGLSGNLQSLWNLDNYLVTEVAAPAAGMVPTRSLLGVGL